jgi:hypothetical protein
LAPCSHKPSIYFLSLRQETKFYTHTTFQTENKSE